VKYNILYLCLIIAKKLTHGIQFVYFCLWTIASDNWFFGSSLGHIKRRSHASIVTRIDKMVSEVSDNLFEIQTSDSYYLTIFLLQRFLLQIVSLFISFLFDFSAHIGVKHLTSCLTTWKVSIDYWINQWSY
jgi:hypothetical protein